MPLFSHQMGNKTTSWLVVRINKTKHLEQSWHSGKGLEMLARDLPGLVLGQPELTGWLWQPVEEGVS